MNNFNILYYMAGVVISYANMHNTRFCEAILACYPKLSFEQANMIFDYVEEMFFMSAPEGLELN